MHERGCERGWGVVAEGREAGVRTLNGKHLPNTHYKNVVSLYRYLSFENLGKAKKGSSVARGTFGKDNDGSVAGRSDIFKRLGLCQDIVKGRRMPGVPNHSKQ